MLRIVLASLCVKLALACPSDHPCPACGRCWESATQKESGGCYDPCAVAPPTPPSPTPSKNTFRQTSCDDGACTDECHSHDFRLNTCYALREGGSAIVLTCFDDHSDWLTYSEAKCQGTGTPKRQDVSKCDPATAGGYIKNLCLDTFMTARKYNETEFAPRMHSNVFNV